MTRGDWQRRFGAKRRAIDRALLEELERQIAAEERLDWAKPYTEPDPYALEARERLARAFGREVK